ncbi:MAG TPA: energy transducer TonB [Chryseolinea sp.]|nr:energy transducer TonB [Chryseolinea sp.]
MKIKINSMETNSNLSDDEIRSYMNFDKIVESARKHSAKRRIRYSWIALPAILALVSVWLVIDNHRQNEGRSTHLAKASKIGSSGSHETANDSEGPANPGRQSATTDSTSASEKRTASDVNAAGAKGRRNRALESTKSESPRKISSARSIPGAANELPKQSVTPPGETSAKDTYVQAEPRQGYTHLYAYFSEQLSYPPQAVKDSIEGIETVSFTIDERGRPTHISITHSLGSAFDQEAIRLIREMPDWTPATLNGSPVASQLSVPLTFQLKRIKKP